MNRGVTGWGLAATAALSLTASVAHADLFVGLQQDAGPIVTVASNAAGFVIFGGAFGNFEQVTVAAFGQPSTVLPTLLQSGSQQLNAENNAGAADAGVLTIYITSTGNTSLTGLAEFTSGFASVNLTPSWTETLRTYLDPGNGIYATTTLLGSAFFTTVASDMDTAFANTGAGPYSVTAVYRVTAPTLGTAGSTVGLSAVETTVVPEPASLALLGAALAGFGIFTRRRRTAA